MNFIRQRWKFLSNIVYKRHNVFLRCAFLSKGMAMINYFYNIVIKGDECDFYTDVLTGVRKDYSLSKVKQKGKITQNSDSDTVFYEFCIEKDKVMKWLVSDAKTIISDVKSIEDSKYCVNFYSDEGLSKTLTFSKYHTLLKVEYFNIAMSSIPTYVIEPRKNHNDLCLLLSKKSSYLNTILYPMPDIEDEYIADLVENEFSDFSAVASTNVGVVRFLSEEQLELFEEFVEKAQERKELEFAPESYIDESDAVLAHKLNPKDFNIRKNLAQSVDITKAQEFSLDADEEIAKITGEYNTPVEEKAEEFVVTPEEVAVDEIIEDTPEEVATDEIIDEIPVEEVVDTETEVTVDEVITDIEEKNDAPVVIETLDEDYSDVKEPVESFDEKLADELHEAEIVPVVELPEDVFDTENLSDSTFEVSVESPADAIIDSANTKYLYYGDLDNNGNRSGYGRTCIESGRTAYEGEYKDNKRDGVGAYYYKDGSLCYYGEWKNNKREGFGVGISSFDKSVHVGKFSENKPFGDGVRFDENGEISFVKRVLSNGVTLVMYFDEDKVTIYKYNIEGEVISENTSSLMYF